MARLRWGVVFGTIMIDENNDCTFDVMIDERGITTVSVSDHDEATTCFLDYAVRS